MGNQENIPGECVSGFIPATNTHGALKQRFKLKHLHNITSLSFSRLTESNIFVQRGLKVTSKAVQHRVRSHGESEALIAVIVHV